MEVRDAVIAILLDRSITSASGSASALTVSIRHRQTEDRIEIQRMDFRSPHDVTPNQPDCPSRRPCRLASVGIVLKSMSSS